MSFTGQTVRRISEKRGQRGVGNSRVTEPLELREDSLSTVRQSPHGRDHQEAQGQRLGHDAACRPPLAETCTSTPPPGLANRLSPPRALRAEPCDRPADGQWAEVMYSPETPDSVSLSPVTKLKRVRPPNANRAKHRTPQRFPWRNESAVFPEPKQREQEASTQNQNLRWFLLKVF